MKNLYVSGYRSFELSIFQASDPKVKRIKKVLKSYLTSFLEEGLEWVIISGNLGVEQWTAQVVAELKEDYPELKLALVYPYENFGQQWKESNQEKKAEVESLCDFIASVSKHPYTSFKQLKNHTYFLLTHTDGTLLVYDEEFPGKTKFFVEEAKRFQKEHSYEINYISFDDLQNYEE